ncbi:MAG: CPBP family intramembrane metalloprotease [Planctomycetaceae bacterium]|nr:CPBP family intramembrane metalloprotease [Planctomycetaceae bacterium]
MFSLLLGWVYYRTQQLVPCFLMHAALNALSFALILL